ncbi:MAG: metallophosphoesterase [Clostridia bacterium]|nr:metallophosphoesterase [Clostridia bacterium]
MTRKLIRFGIILCTVLAVFAFITFSYSYINSEKYKFFPAKSNTLQPLVVNPSSQLSTPTPQNTASTFTSPQPSHSPSPQTLRFVVLADSRGDYNGVNSKAVRKTMERIKQLSPQPEFAVMPGDLCDGAKTLAGTKLQLQYFKKIVTEYYPSQFFFPGVGNHEMRAGIEGEMAFSAVFGEFKANFLEGFNRTVYYFDRGNTRFFMLNTNHPGETHTIGNKQLNWVKSNISSTKQHHMFFLHEPPYPTGSQVGSALDANRLQRNKLWRVIDSSNGPMVFCGHEHNYTRRHINSAFNDTFQGIDFKFSKKIYQLTVGSFGAPLYTKYTSKKNVDVPPIAQYHFAVVDITGSKVTVTVYNLDGKIIDGFQQGA